VKVEPAPSSLSYTVEDVYFKEPRPYTNVASKIEQALVAIKVTISRSEPLWKGRAMTSQAPTRAAPPQGRHEARLRPGQPDLPAVARAADVLDPIARLPVA
jgi:hypothetical protein